MSNSTKIRIVETADQLFYQSGFASTSFAHIAKAVGISRGNFYHHFKSKDEILSAVIELRLSNTQEMLEAWNIEGQDAKGRIKCFINILIMNSAKIKLYGCPVGTLTTELSKLEHHSLVDANRVFTLFSRWLTDQFLLAGQKDNANKLAKHLLARSQGVATLASAFQDEEFIEEEVEQLLSWLDSVVK